MIPTLAVAAALSDFNSAASRVTEALGRARTAQFSEKADDLGPRIAALDDDLLTRRQDAEQLRRDLADLKPRLWRYQSGRPDSDPALRYDVPRLSNAARILAREVRMRSSDLRWISAQAEKNPALVDAASRLNDDALQFNDTARQLRFESDDVLGDLRRAGFNPDASDIDRSVRDASDDAQTLQNDAQTLLLKVRG